MGQLTVLSTIFNLQTNSLDGAVPTQLGHMTGLTYYLGLSNNKLTKAVPTQLGRMTGLASALLLSSNELCNDLPTEVAALSSAAFSDWATSTANDIGSPCPPDHSFDFRGAAAAIDGSTGGEAQIAVASVSVPFTSTVNDNSPTGAAWVDGDIAQGAGVEYKDAPNLDVADCDAAAAGSYVTADFGQVRDLTKVVLWCVQACERATDLFFFFVASTERCLLLPQYF